MPFARHGQNFNDRNFNKIWKSCLNVVRVGLHIAWQNLVISNEAVVRKNPETLSGIKARNRRHGFPDGFTYFLLANQYSRRFRSKAHDATVIIRKSGPRSNHVTTASGQTRLPKS